MHFLRKPLKRLGMVLFVSPIKVVAFSASQLTTTVMGRYVTRTSLSCLRVTIRLLLWAFSGSVHPIEQSASSFPPQRLWSFSLAG
jgi:hypothetical protein